MINNSFEIWYWTIVLALLVCFAVYRGFCLVRDMLSALKKHDDDDAPAIAPTVITRNRLITRYSNRMVVVHWLTLGLVIAAWLLGDNLAELRHERSTTLGVYLIHIVTGGTVLLLTLLRMTFRSEDGVPPPIGHSLMDMVAVGIHRFLYVMLILLPATGFMIFLTSSVGLALMTGDASLLPTEYNGTGIIPHAAHKVLMTVLIWVLAVHILGALMHQFILKDGLMKRMSLSRK